MTGEGHGLGVDSNDDGEHFHLLNERLMLHAACHEVLLGACAKKVDAFSMSQLVPVMRRCL